MSTLDDKILGEKLHYYCSSSEDEEEAEEDTNNDNIEDKPINYNIREEALHKWDGCSANTGPKGVIKDWQQFKRFENEKKERNQTEKLELMKKLSISCGPHSDQQTSDNGSDHMNDDMNDDFLKEYTIRRMQQMMDQINRAAKERPDFGKLVYLESGSQFLEAIDSEQKLVTIICHIFNKEVNHCQQINICLNSLAEQYMKIKFCAIEASTAGMSSHFSRSGVPALLVYRSGNLLANFVRLSDQFTQPFNSEDMEKFLIDHGLLNQALDTNPSVRRSIRDSAFDTEDVSD